MRISWVIADAAQLDPTVDLVALKNIGPMWGGWQTWRSWATDNVVCHDAAQARNLVSNNFHKRCNMYVSAANYRDLNRPTDIHLYQGDFHQIVNNPDDIVSMHLASLTNDIILLFGYDLTLHTPDSDKLSKHKWHNYTQYFMHIITDSPDVQWVLLDHIIDKEHELNKVSNFQIDTLKNILTQFS